MTQTTMAQPALTILGGAWLGDELIAAADSQSVRRLAGHSGHGSVLCKFSWHRSVEPHQAGFPPPDPNEAAAWVPIRGATKPLYRPVDADVGHYLRVTVLPVSQGAAGGSTAAAPTDATRSALVAFAGPVASAPPATQPRYHTEPFANPARTDASFSVLRTSGAQPYSPQPTGFQAHGREQSPGPDYPTHQHGALQPSSSSPGRRVVVEGQYTAIADGPNRLTVQLSPRSLAVADSGNATPPRAVQPAQQQQSLRSPPPPSPPPPPAHPQQHHPQGGFGADGWRSAHATAPAAGGGPGSPWGAMGPPPPAGATWGPAWGWGQPEAPSGLPALPPFGGGGGAPATAGTGASTSGGWTDPTALSDPRAQVPHGPAGNGLPAWAALSPPAYLQQQYGGAANMPYGIPPSVVSGPVQTTAGARPMFPGQLAAAPSGFTVDLYNTASTGRPDMELPWVLGSTCSGAHGTAHRGATASPHSQPLRGSMPLWPGQHGSAAPHAQDHQTGMPGSARDLLPGGGRDGVAGIGATGSMGRHGGWQAPGVQGGGGAGSGSGAQEGAQGQPNEAQGAGEGSAALREALAQLLVQHQEAVQQVVQDHAALGHHGPGQAPQPSSTQPTGLPGTATAPLAQPSSQPSSQPSAQPAAASTGVTTSQPAASHPSQGQLPGSVAVQPGAATAGERQPSLSQLFDAATAAGFLAETPPAALRTASLPRRDSGAASEVRSALDGDVPVQEQQQQQQQQRAQKGALSLQPAAQAAPARSQAQEHHNHPAHDGEQQPAQPQQQQQVHALHSLNAALAEQLAESARLQADMQRALDAALGQLGALKEEQDRRQQQPHVQQQGGAAATGGSAGSWPQAGGGAAHGGVRAAVSEAEGAGDSSAEGSISLGASVQQQEQQHSHGEEGVERRPVREGEAVERLVAEAVRVAEAWGRAGGGAAAAAALAPAARARAGAAGSGASTTGAHGTWPAAVAGGAASAREHQSEGWVHAGQPGGAGTGAAQLHPGARGTGVGGGGNADGQPVVSAERGQIELLKGQMRQQQARWHAKKAKLKQEAQAWQYTAWRYATAWKKARELLQELAAQQGGAVAAAMGAADLPHAPDPDHHDQQQHPSHHTARGGPAPGDHPSAPLGDPLGGAHGDLPPPSFRPIPSPAPQGHPRSASLAAAGSQPITPPRLRSSSTPAAPGNTDRGVPAAPGLSLGLSPPGLAAGIADALRRRLPDMPAEQAAAPAITTATAYGDRTAHRAAATSQATAAAAAAAAAATAAASSPLGGMAAASSARSPLKTTQRQSGASGAAAPGLGRVARSANSPARRAATNAGHVDGGGVAATGRLRSGSAPTAGVSPPRGSASPASKAPGPSARASVAQEATTAGAGAPGGTGAGQQRAAAAGSGAGEGGMGKGGTPGAETAAAGSVDGDVDVGVKGEARDQGMSTSGGEQGGVVAVPGATAAAVAAAARAKEVRVSGGGAGGIGGGRWSKMPDGEGRAAASMLEAVVQWPDTLRLSAEAGARSRSVSPSRPPWKGPGPPSVNPTRLAYRPTGSPQPYGALALPRQGLPPPPPEPLPPQPYRDPNGWWHYPPAPQWLGVQAPPDHAMARLERHRSDNSSSRGRGRAGPGLVVKAAAAGDADGVGVSAGSGLGLKWGEVDSVSTSEVLSTKG